jgi:uncharacterized membrane protein YphA (DoxX/SURF4 family)
VDSKAIDNFNRNTSSNKTCGLATGRDLKVGSIRMNWMLRFGRVAFGVAAIGFAAQQFLHVISQGPSPGPPWTPSSTFLLNLAAAALFSAGVTFVSGWNIRLGAAVLAGVLLLRILLIHLPSLLTRLHDPGPWTSTFEIVALTGAALALATLPTIRSRNANNAFTVSRLLFAISLIVFGVQHVMYGPFIANLIPSWIPFRLFFAYFVGAAFFVASLSFITKIKASLSGFMLGLMFLIWVVILHAPRIAAASHNQNEWTSGLIALAMCGAGFIFAGVFADQRD